jgi:uncharacterized protein DUF2834
MSLLRMIYLALAIVGTIGPTVFFVSWFQVNGFDLPALLAVWGSNDATTGLVWDLSISAVALTVFILAEVYVRKDFWVLICIPATFVIGLSSGLPLYLFLRTRPID